MTTKATVAHGVEKFNLVHAIGMSYMDECKGHYAAAEGESGISEDELRRTVEYVREVADELGIDRQELMAALVAGGHEYRENWNDSTMVED